ncbi:MAG: YwbE family protein [Candidatus Thorarchaeota archaeon]
MNPSTKKSGTIRKVIHLGATVDIVMKKDQRSGNLTRGIVKDILTNSPTHPHGIKVRLQSGQVGRVQSIVKLHTE